MTIAVACGLLLAAGGTVHARMTAAEQCEIAKLRATARLVAQRLRCEAQAAQEGSTAGPDCVSRANDKLSAAFARADAGGGCALIGTAGTVLALVDDSVADSLEALRPVVDANRCAAVKLRLAGRHGFAELVCHAAEIRKEGSATQCLARAAAVLASAFARAERRPPCLTTNDDDTIDLWAQLLGASVREVLHPIATPSNLAAVIENNDDVALDWTAPDPSSGNTHVRILRRLNATPSGPTDPAAAVVFFGTATEAADDLASLLPDTTTVARTYHYAAYGCTSGGDCAALASTTALTPTVVQALRAGGYVVHWRHASADVCTDKTNLGTAATTMSPDWWKSCDANCATATARQLNATGLGESTTIGQAFDTLGIPVGRVLTSEFCRNFTTAQLMDFGPTLEYRQDITFFVYEEANRCASTQALLAETPTAGWNTAIIGHAGFSCPILDSLAWGEAAIYKPNGMGGSTFIQRVLATGWDDLP